MKLNKYIIPLALTVLLTGCNKLIEPFYLSDEFYTSENSGLNYVDYDTIETKIEEKASFACLIHILGCGTCYTFSALVDDYAKTNDLMFYALEIRELKTYNPSLYDKIEYAPAFLLFKEGEDVVSLKSNDNKQIEYFKYKKSFKEWFETYIIVTPPEI